MAVMETVVAGNLIYKKISVRGKSPEGKPRAKREKPTSAEVEKVNQRNAERELQIKVHHNFKAGDYHVVFTYSGDEPGIDQAKGNLRILKKKLRELYRERGILLKWIAVTEYLNKRIHHHFLISAGVEFSEIAKIWPHGYVRPVQLDSTGDYRRLADYLIKETSKTFRAVDSVGRRRYSCSRTVIMPEVKIEEVSNARLFKEPKPAKGYYIDQESLYRGENPVSGVPYMEYVMVALGEESRIDKYRRGRKGKYKRENYSGWIRKNTPVQTLIDGLL